MFYHSNTSHVTDYSVFSDDRLNTFQNVLAVAARQPLFSVNSALTCQSIYVCLSADFRRCKRLQRSGNPLQPGVAYIQIVYDHTAGVYNIFLGALCGCH